MAPARDSGLYVSIPARASTVLVLLDPAGRPRSGWPITLTGATGCAEPMAVDDGSVRLVCSIGADQMGRAAPQRAYTFDIEGRSLQNWPVDVPGASCGGSRVVARELWMLACRDLKDTDPATGLPHADAWLVAVSADGGMRTGARARTGFATRWSLGPDGVAYGTTNLGLDAPHARSELVALGLDGVRTGWPLQQAGVASAPAFGPDGRILVTVGSFEESRSRLHAFEPDGTPSVGYPELAVATAEQNSEYVVFPADPAVGSDGTAFVVTDEGGATTAYAADTSGTIRRGWPYRTSSRLVHPGYCPPTSELGCYFPPADAAVGPGEILFLLTSGSDRKGGAAVAIGTDGRIRSGWPVSLRRAGSEFQSIVVGPDGTAYALAVEPEGAGRSSATILAITPTGVVDYRSTIVEP